MLPNESPLNEKVLEKRNEGSEKDNEKEIARKDLMLEISDDGSPLVTYLVESSSLTKRKRRRPASSGDESIDGIIGDKRTKRFPRK